MLAGPVYTGMSPERHWLTQCTFGIPLGDPRILAGYTGTPLKKLSWNYPKLECHWRNSDYCSLHWNTFGWTVTDPPHTQTNVVKQSSIHASLKWQDVGTPSSNRTGLCKFGINWSLLLCNAYQFCSWNVWVLQHHSVHALDICTVMVYVYLGLQFKWNQLSSNNSRHTSGIHKVLHAEKWPYLITSTPDAVSTLGYHWTDYTGTTLADAITQWSSSGNPVLICIIGTHWKTTETPLEDHCKTTGNTLAANNYFLSYSSGIPVFTGLPLDCHCITTGSG